MSRLIRPLGLLEVEELLRWAAVEGWNPGLDDAAPFHAADPDGFIGAFVDGEMVAGISAIAYGERFGFIGLYICRPEWRGQGHGKAVWDAGMARLAGRTIGLDGVPEQQANYRGMGFVRSYETVRMTGLLPASAGADDAVEVTSQWLPQLLPLDRQCFPAPRPAFLEAWLAPPRRALAVIEDGPVRGYGVVRRCIEGSKIGPLFVEDGETAWRLLGGLAAAAAAPVQIDVPVAQQGFLRRLEDAGFAPGFSTARMYRGNAPQIEAAQVFGITSLELG